MSPTIAEVDKLFAVSAQAVTLTRAEWEAIQEVSKRSLRSSCDAGLWRR
jgi:hypothetical protein